MYLSEYTISSYSKFFLTFIIAWVVRYKQNVVKHDEFGETIYPEGTSFLQYVSDNKDHDMATLDGKDTHHGLGSIAIANVEVTSASFRRQKNPQDKREAWNDVKSNDGIKIIQHMAPNVPSLTKAILKPLFQVSINILYSVS